MAAQRRGIGNVMNQSMPPLLEVSEALEMELTDTAPYIDNSTTAAQ